MRIIILAIFSLFLMTINAQAYHFEFLDTDIDSTLYNDGKGLSLNASYQIDTIVEFEVIDIIDHGSITGIEYVAQEKQVNRTTIGGFWGTTMDQIQVVSDCPPNQNCFQPSVIIANLTEIGVNTSVFSYWEELSGGAYAMLPPTEAYAHSEANYDSQNLLMQSQITTGLGIGTYLEPRAGERFTVDLYDSFTISTLTLGEVSYESSFSFFGPNTRQFADIGYTFTVDLFAFARSEIRLHIINEEICNPLNPVPEPATILLFGTGLLSLVGIGRRRKKK